MPPVIEPGEDVEFGIAVQSIVAGPTNEGVIPAVGTVVECTGITKEGSGLAQAGIVGGEEIISALGIVFHFDGIAVEVSVRAQAGIGDREGIIPALGTTVHCVRHRHRGQRPNCRQNC